MERLVAQSHREVPADLRRIQLGDAPPEDDLPPGEDGAVLGQLQGEVQVLLHQDDGHLALEQRPEHPADLLDGGGLDALGRLVEEEQPGPRDQGPGDGQLLLLAAREVAAAPVPHGAEDGEELLQLGAGTPSLLARADSPTLRFSATVSREKISRPCGT